jgi:hypothetical protein
MPGETGVTCGDDSRVLFLFAREAAGALEPGIPCALCFERRDMQAELARITRRDREAIWLHMYVDAYGGLFETLNRRQWIAWQRARPASRPRSLSTRPAAIRQQLRAALGYGKSGHIPDRP